MIRWTNTAYKKHTEKKAKLHTKILTGATNKQEFQSVCLYTKLCIPTDSGCTACTRKNWDQHTVQHTCSIQ